MALADLDPQTSQINLPLEAYMLSGAEEHLVDHANALLMQACMARAGFTYPVPPFDADAPPVPDRRYGIWSIEDASAHGFDTPMDHESAVTAAAQYALGDDWNRANNECYQGEDILQPVGDDGHVDGIIATLGMDTSFNDLHRSNLLQEVRDAWVGCMDDKGVAVDPTTDYMLPDTSGPEGRSKELALVGATCMDELDVVKQLAGWESSQQLEYIKQHQEELTASRAAADDTLERARQIIAGTA
ncbi:hypothetical protein [Clavibacter zhangzhiyongii]|uniref:hypothetical protein n=1 Tax=Clavibacter TaxID=1573 RepID=UPI0039E08A41